jgi:hypothetical protein
MSCSSHVAKDPQFTRFIGQLRPAPTVPLHKVAYTFRAHTHGELFVSDAINRADLRISGITLGSELHRDVHRCTFNKLS